MAEKSEELAAMEAINKLKSTEPPQFLSPNNELSLCSRLSSRYIFRLLKPHTPKSPFEELLTEGFDAEQIWQQIDIQSQPLISSLKRAIKRFERNPNQISSLFDGDEENEVFEKEFQENGDAGLEIDDEDDEDDDIDNDDVDDDDVDEDEDDDDDEDDVDEDDDGDGVPEVEDDFLKINELEKFLRREEKKEYGGDDEVKTKTKKKKREIDNKTEGNEDDEESESDDDLGDAGINELLMYGGDDDEDKAQYNMRYEEFYLPNKKTPKSGRRQVTKSDDMDMEDEENVMPKRKQKQVTEVGESDEPESDDGDETENNNNLSTHEKERQKLQAKIKQMEEANLAAKDWTMQGEVTASKRPRDSALEVDLDFEHNVRPPPVITEEVTTSLEDMIKKRISEGHFDDVQKAPKLPSSAPKEKKELDDNKSKKGLAEIYEEEYAKQTGLGTVPLSHNDELRKEATGLFKKLCLKLDALSHFHFAPKPVVEDMTIQTNVPALAMEEIASVAVSDAAMLAPEEVFAGKGDIKEDTELTKEDRKKRRASKKRKFKAINAAKTANRPADKPLQNNGEGQEV